MHLTLWIIVALAITGILVRPFRWPEAVWAVAGAVLIVVCGLLPMGQSLQAVGKGADVYLFLIGMMLLSETARREGLFDWVAVLAVNAARGSTRRLFLLIYAVGVVVTVFLSNDATAVVLTPAVFAAARKANTGPLPLLFVCAFVANAASFVLPISNPANIVLYGDHTPPLLQWLERFALPSLLAIVATFFCLRITQRHTLLAPCATGVEAMPLQPGARIALIGLGLTAMVLMTVSALDMKLGLPTAVLGIFTAVVVMLRESRSPLNLVKGISWTVLPLVAGLFVIVEAVDRIGIAAELGRWLGTSASEWKTAALSAGVIAVGSNLVNNLPAGLLASSAIESGHLPQRIVDALLIGVDLGPNLSITGSLATLLWLAAIRREGENVDFWSFLRVGLVVMPPALIVTIAARLL
jgi:arsenical pump membrane protein